MQGVAETCPTCKAEQQKSALYCSPHSRLQLVVATVLTTMALCLSGCGFAPKPDALSEPALKSLAFAESKYDVKPLHPDMQVPLSRQALIELRKTDPASELEGATYSFTTANALPEGWLVQTPDAWGQRAAEVAHIDLTCSRCEANDLRLPRCQTTNECKVGACRGVEASEVFLQSRSERLCAGNADTLLDRIYRIVRGARRSVDMLLLQPPSNGRFLGALRNAIMEQALSGHYLTVRILIGQYPGLASDVPRFVTNLVGGLDALPDNHVVIYATAIQTCTADPACGGFSWNHAKVVVADGQRAFVGGHNQWTGDYLLGDPVHDLSMEITGAAARDAHAFADALCQ